MKSLKTIISIALLSIVLLTGCNQGKNNSSNASASELASSNLDETVIRMAFHSEIDSLDPQIAAATDTESIMANVFDGLVDTDESGVLEPRLATAWSISNDHLTYNFKLVENAVFHNGDPVTAKDVVYSYGKLAGLETGEPLSDKWAVVESIVAVNDYEVNIKLKHADSGFLARTISAIIPADYEEQATHPIGAGPFKFIEYKIGQEIVMERFDDYYLTDKVPQYKGLRFIYLPDQEAALLAMQANEIDIMTGVSQQGLQQLGNKITTISGPQNMVVMMGLNHTVEPFNDLKVRQAINLAIDKQQIIDTAMEGLATKVDSNFSPAMEFYYEDAVENYYETNIDEAKKLLAEAGFPDGFSFTLTAPSHSPMYIDVAQILASQLSQIGIDVNIESVEWNTWLDRVYTKFEHEATLIAFTGKLDPYDVLIRFVDGYSRNFIQYNNPVFDEAIDKGIKETDENKKVQHYKEAQRILTEDAASVFIMDPDRTIIMREGITGLKQYPIQKYNLEDLQVSK